MPGFPSASQTVALVRKNGVKPTGAAVSRNHLHRTPVQVSLGFRGGGASPAVYTCRSLFSYLRFEYLNYGYLTTSEIICQGILWNRTKINARSPIISCIIF